MIQDNLCFRGNDPLEGESRVSWVTDTRVYIALAPFWDVGGFEGRIRRLT